MFGCAHKHEHVPLLFEQIYIGHYLAKERNVNMLQYLFYMSCCCVRLAAQRSLMLIPVHA